MTVWKGVVLGVAGWVGLLGCNKSEHSEDAVEQVAREAFPEPLALIPDASLGVLVVRPAALLDSALGRALEPELRRESAYRELVDGLERCSMPASRLQRVVAGSGKDDEFAVVLVGEGIGTDATATCVIQALQRSVGAEQQATIEIHDGKKLVDFPDGRVYLVNADTIVVVTATWRDQVEALIDGEGKPAIAHGKKQLIAKLDPEAAIWLGSDLPPDLQMMANFIGVPALGQAKTLLFSLKLDAGATTELTVGFETEAGAREAARELGGLLETGKREDQLRPLLDRLSLGQSGVQLRLRFVAELADIARLTALAGAK